MVVAELNQMQPCGIKATPSPEVDQLASDPLDLNGAELLHKGQLNDDVLDYILSLFQDKDNQFVTSHFVRSRQTLRVRTPKLFGALHVNGNHWVAYYNAGGDPKLWDSLEKLSVETPKLELNTLRERLGYGRVQVENSVGFPWLGTLSPANIAKLCPQQTNGMDCGLIVILVLMYALAGAAPPQYFDGPWFRALLLRLWNHFSKLERRKLDPK
jgi:hypothetical protein